MMMHVIRAADGKLLNIGPWDEQRRTEEIPGLLGPDGAPILREVVVNPIPPGAYDDQAEVVEGFDGGLYLADDPRRFG